ncbi:GNAT family N-acetyltransferase [Candidatus Woesearchaeota archaeon]|nr:GNAT family N-acetyltransferase [Candidatus Woesearchaeota archaeon]
MEKIIRLNRRHFDDIVNIDICSEHQGDTSNNTSKLEMRKDLISRFDDGYEIFFGFKHDSELIGYVTLKPFFPGYKHCEVYWLAVKKKYQGKGIGTSLMKYVEEYAKSLGFRKICLYTGKDMNLTRKFYEKIGYSFVNEFPGYYGYLTGNTTAVLYAKLL